MVMVVSFYILGVYNMANGLEHIANILKRLNDEIKLDNDKWERANGSRDVLHTSNDGTTTARGSDNGSCGKFEKQNNSKHGE
jgi:hypothetical protein